MAAQMDAVVFKGPYEVSVEQRPIPHIQDPLDIIVKVTYAAICGSDLHVYRGHLDSPTDFIMGHEFMGTVVEAGKDIKSVRVGDKVVCPFTLSCGNCFYCLYGNSSRCEKGLLFGSPQLDGAQAEFVRVPWADGTVVKSPTGIEDKALVLMADIFPTGFFGAKNAFKHLSPKLIADATIVVIGCGPVGLCAIVAAAQYKPKHLFAVDGVQSRLDLARGLGAIPFNFLTERKELDQAIREVTDGRGADAVIEVVGLSPALRMAFDLLRPWGVISSIGVHNNEIPWTAKEAYAKNLTLQMGRCPARSIFPEALALLLQKQHLFSFMFDNIVTLSSAKKSYDSFEKMQVQKVIFHFPDTGKDQ